MALLSIKQHDTPVLSLAMHPNGTLAAVACKGGRLTVHQLTMSVVHGLYQNMYAHRQDLCLPVSFFFHNQGVLEKGRHLQEAAYAS